MICIMYYINYLLGINIAAIGSLKEGKVAICLKTEYILVLTLK